MSSPVSISGVQSISDVNSVIGVGEDSAPALNTLEASGNRLFELGDGDIRILINGTSLETHRYIIKRFSRFKSKTQNDPVILDSDECKVEDFRNTFKIIYASVIEGPFEFDHLTLISALRVATLYDYPALRAFAIKHLEKKPLSAVERIRLAREFELLSWKEPAYVELCNREEAITNEEASVLGIDTFVHVARIREREQRRRGKEVDAKAEASNNLAVEGREGEIEVMRTGPSSSQAKESSQEELKATPFTSDLSQGKDNVTKLQVSERRKVETTLKPSFVDAPLHDKYWCATKPTRIDVVVPDCQCNATYGAKGSPQAVEPCICKLPPCAFAAFKNIQTQQLSHNSNISKLESTMDQVQATLASLTVNSDSHERLDPSEEPSRIGSVHEEVRKWLADIENRPTTT